jgi:hypothetical protein
MLIFLSSLGEEYWSFDWHLYNVNYDLP